MGVNNTASKIIYSIFNLFVFGSFIVNLFKKHPGGASFVGLAIGSIFLIASGGLYATSKKDAKDDSNENGPELYKGFLIANSVMVILSIIILIILITLERKGQYNMG